MGRMLLMLILGLSAVFTVTHQSIVKSSNRVLDMTTGKFYKLQSQNIAESGIEFAYNKIKADTNWTGISSLSMAGGKLDITVSKPKAGLRNISSKGSFDGTPISRTVTAQVKIITKTTVTGDPYEPTQICMKKALMSDKDLTLNSGQRVGLADGLTNINADIHTNHNLMVNTGCGIDGYGSYVGSVTLNQKETKTFTPNISEDGVGSLAYKTSTVPIYALNLDTLKTKAYVKVATSGQTTFNLGTKDNPIIWYINVNLVIDSGTKINGYGGFIVNGEVNFNSGCSVTTNSDNNVNNIAIFAKGNVNLNSGSKIEATIFANGGINFNSGCKLYGSAVAGGYINLNSGSRIYYRPALGTVTNNVLPKGTASNVTITKTAEIFMVKGSIDYNTQEKLYY